MDVWTSVLTALAAVAAAVLSATNLLVARHHARTQWVRDALVAALTDFLGASFDSKDAIKAALRLARVDPPPADEIDRLKMEAGEACGRMRAVQAKIRLLANTEVIELAQRLRLAEIEYVAMLNQQPVPTLEIDRAFRSKLHELSHRFVQAAKTELDLRPSEDDRSLTWGRTPPPAVLS